MGNICNRVLTLFVSIITAIIFGLLFENHFLFAVNFFWISFGLAIFVFAVLLISTLIKDKPTSFLRNIQCYIGSIIFGVSGLTASSIIGLIVADSHAISHCILFGINTGFFVYLFMSCLQFIVSCYRRIGDAT